MRNISQEELHKILKEHELWLKGEGGKRADLSYANLRCVNLSNANLEYANLEYVDLIYADLRYADLNHTNLMHADLEYIKTNIYTIGYNLACPEK